ncbi:O-antigen ligase family protein [Lactobacillus corticis]|uniref:O-antigen ligase family protein n=1 Tax=Lactobacillus corticis TaxID=2201249 RepID=A0A916VHZ6_9LACO|nr:O-antigen ligase family protein [Lactobacillus corticis]GFZ26803.1 hypothetical protein LCB40_06830 [Lactobacillus corticis]
MKQKTQTWLYWFIMLQPFLDLYWFYHGKLANALPFTLPTIIRILAVLVILGMFFSQKQNWQKLGQNKWLLAYIALLLIYSIIHLLYVRSFKSLNPTSYGYSVSGEIFYLVRMALPLMVIYFTTQLNFTRTQLKHLVLGLSGLFSYTIVISNLFVISLRSYETGRISANIFQWFVDPNIGYSHMASKGFFNFANMVSAVLFMLLPLVLYYLFSDFSWKTIMASSIQALAMIEIGTKVALIGLIGGLLVAVLVFLFHKYLVKDQKLQKSGKALLTALIIEIVAVAIIPFGPVVQRYNYEKLLANQSDASLTQLNQKLAQGNQKYQNQPEKLKAFQADFVKKYYKRYALNKKFVFKSYPYQYDPAFWVRIMKEPGTQRMQNRYVEKQMLNQARSYNDNRLDYLLGISYMRETNIFNLERDYLSQVYSLGIIGMLLFVGPSVILLLYAIFKWFKRKSYLLSSLILASGFMVMAAFYSGNVMDFLTASFILATINGIMVKLAHDAASVPDDRITA